MKIFKKWWFWVVAVIIVFAVVGSDGGDTTTSGGTSNKPTLSKTEFDQITNGMTYEEVVEIIGSEGEVLSESGTKGEDLHTVIYMWEGEGELGANANFTFQGGKLDMKAQFGLK